MGVPIFVVGFQRSGTTLLQRLLGGHPDIAAAPETHYFFRIYDLRDYYGDLAEAPNLRRAVADLLHPPIPLLDDCRFDDDQLFERVRRRGASYATLLDELLNDLVRREGASRWSEKSPGQPLAQIFEVFPSAQVVHLSRDVVDVIASSLATSWNDGSAVELAGRWGRFERATHATAAQLPPGRYLHVRYEELVLEPRETLAGICGFLGVEPCVDEMLAAQSGMSVVPSFARGWLSKVGAPIDSSSVGKGRAVLSERQQAEIRAAADGGATAPSPAPVAPTATPRERYEATQQFLRDLHDRARR